MHQSAEFYCCFATCGYLRGLISTFVQLTSPVRSLVFTSAIIILVESNACDHYDGWFYHHVFAKCLLYVLLRTPWVCREKETLREIMSVFFSDEISSYRQDGATTVSATVSFDVTPLAEVATC